VFYACYSGVGWRVLGFLPGYGTEEGLDNGSGIWLLAGLQTIAPLPAYASKIYGAVVLLVLGALALWAMTRPDSTNVRSVCGRTALLAACATAAIGPHYAWYYAWLALPAVVSPSKTVLWLSAAPVLLFVSPFEGSFLWPSLVYGPAILLALTELRLTLSPIEGTPRCPQRL
jgi:alpha-1,6-mannosyltransferase